MKLQLGSMSQGVSALVICAVMICAAHAQSPRVLYTWSGSGDTRGWGPAFGDQTEVTYDNNIAGVLRFSEGAGHGGTSYALADEANRLDDTPGTFGGLDLFGLEALEFDLGMNNSDGTGVNVAFFVQASPSFTFINIPDILIPDTNNVVNTYTFPLSSLTDAEKAHIRVIGLEVRAHTGSASFRLAEVRSAGTPADSRVIATHEDGSLENGFNGARLNFDQAAVLGNDGGANQSGLSVGDGMLSWVDLGGSEGAAISYQNGQHPWEGNDFESRPHDNSNYNYAVFRVRATDLAGNVGTSVAVQGFTQTNLAYQYQTLGPDQNLAIDGQWYDLAFPLADVVDRIYTNNISLNFQAHDNDIRIDIDSAEYRTILVPEPTTLALWGLAWLGLAGLRRR